MENGFKIREVKYFLYKTPAGNFLELPVPDDMDQTYVGSIISSEYLITKMTVGRDIAEVEISTLKVGSSTVGYLIPRQAILSQEHPKNGDPLYAAYALIAAQKVCNDSMDNLYDLIGSEEALNIRNGIEGFFCLLCHLFDTLCHQRIYKKRMC